MKKSLACLLLAVLLVSLLAACGGGGETTGGGTTTPPAQPTQAAGNPTPGGSSGAPTTITITFPGDPSLDWEKVRDVIAEMCQADGLNVVLEAIYIPFSDLTQRNQLMMNAGEKIDLMFDAPFASLNQNIAAGFYEPLEDLLDQYGQNILETRGSAMMEYNKFNDRIYAIPMGYYIKSGNQLYIRKDMREAAGVENPPTNWDEAIEMCYAIKAAFPDKPVIGCAADNYRYVRIKAYEMSIEGLRDYIPDIYLDPGGTEFKHPVIERENSALWPLYLEARQLYLDGIIDPDSLSVNSHGDSFASGKVSVIQTVDFGITESNYAALVAAEPQATFENVTFQDPNKPGEVYSHFRQWNFQTVPIFSVNKELAIQFLDWANASQENYDICAYGILGEHWELKGESNVSISTAYSGRPYAWVWNPVLNRLPGSIPDWQIPIAKAYLDQDYFAVSALAGFNADFEPIATEWAQHQAIYAKYSVIEYGFMDPAEALEQWAAEDLANINILLTELNRQLAEHLAKRGS